MPFICPRYSPVEGKPNPFNGNLAGAVVARKSSIETDRSIRLAAVRVMGETAQVKRQPSERLLPLHNHLSGLESAAERLSGVAEVVRGVVDRTPEPEADGFQPQGRLG